ncbi:hypothetical protein [Humibacter ginsenosidimutans]|uniref:Scaffolding protein n=1 Tax=Humibacter ginsenosidimutans TaxID=2599293 RepID=A0A5B8M7Z9_9MICO|nr:hypothetical protein [Humibacter ginsenosidimutans]QDZ15785.1 hypothetical protein FPZ11_14345 [Humibacter ginsenosidimutans]
MSSNINPAFTRRDADGLACIGRTLHDLRGIRFGNGENGNAPDGSQGGDNGAQGATPPWGDDPSKFDPDKAWKLIQNVKGDLDAEKSKRDQAIKDAVAQAQQGWTQQIGQALGLTNQVETDPAKLQQAVQDLQVQMFDADEQLTAAEQQAKVAELKIAVLSNPAIRDANPKLLLANKAFTDSIGQVEPTDEAAITAAINQALQANAALKATPSRSGSGEHQGATVQSLETQLAAAQTAGDKTETIRLKMAIAAARRRAKGA